MPKLDRKINDVYATVTRPVAIAVLRQISELCGWDYNRENILFRGEALHAKMSAANEQPPQVVDQDVKGPADGFIQIELNIVPEEQASMYDTVYKRNSLPVFEDRNLGVSLVPVYSTMVATMQITKRFEDQVTAERWWYDMKRLLTSQHVAAFLSAEYSYAIPTQFLMLLKVIHTHREAIAGYGDKFSEYLRDGFDNRATTMTTVAGDGKSVKLVIREMQEEISGQFDFTDAPKPEKNENSSSYNATFSYRYTYDTPTHIVARYPVQVHQQILPEEYLYKPSLSVRDKSRARRGGMVVQYQDILRDSFLPEQGASIQAYRYPDLDEWLPPSSVETELPSSTLFTALLAIDPEQPNLLVTLDSLAEEGEFHPDLVRWFREYPEWSKCHYQSPFFLEVWKGKYRYARDAWTLTDVGDLEAKDPLDLRSDYHVRLAILLDLSQLQVETLEALCCYPNLVDELFAVLGLDKKYWPKKNSRGCYTLIGLIEAIKRIPTTASWFKHRSLFVPRILVGTIVGVKRYGAR
ncbi:TPA: hypothetical protein OKR56_000626 [Escherichia coli]|nr:hypothetical protein [Salmonella enterica subsp. enterica serovar Enteritidis]EDQ3175877.1 hypothetical protein [Salmonella enterica subsp. enterica]HCQ4163512.1 hypothetical protein [Escherichia coli]